MYYTLENHLKFISNEHEEYAVLYSNWLLNKKSLPLALTNILFNFPHYSIHDKSHSDTIIKNIESFLGVERIKKLGPTTTWLILMSAYTHDIGMVVFSKSIEEKWDSPDFVNFLTELSTKKNDKSISESAALLLEIKNYNLEKLKDDKSLNPIRIRQALVLISAEYFRREHHQRSNRVIVGNDSEFSELLANFYSNLIPNRFMDLLGKIAISHGESFDYILDEIDYEENGLGSDKVNPRFVSCLLKLGDLLDIDDLRFNAFSEKVLDKKLPEVSNNHKIKHSSVKHFLINPEGIEITVNCQNYAVYRVARQWFDWLEEEVENQVKNWNQISPKELSGFPPSLTSGKIKVLYQGVLPDRKLLDLKFSINPKKAIEIFEGGGIYEKPHFVFIREVIQNAIDANHIQLWKDIRQGRYNHIISKHLSLSHLSSTSDVIDKLKFPSDIPIEILSNYQVDLYIEWENDNKDVLVFKIKDNGCGISKNNLFRLTNSVGESRSKDYDYIDLKKDMPYWLKPTGAFGLGLQSIFLVVDSFNIYTKSEEDEGMEIEFNSSKYGDYSFVKNINNTFTRGTTIEIKIKESEFDNVFDNTYSFDIIEKYDYFSDDRNSLYIYKIEEYILKEFKELKELNVYSPISGQILKSQYENQLPAPDFNKFIYSDNKLIQLELRVENKKEIIYDIFENQFIGSQIRLSFFSCLSNSLDLNNKYTKFKFYVRGIEINDNFSGLYSFPYTLTEWNFLNTESDKILNIARSKLIYKQRKIHTSLFGMEIVPEIIELMVNGLIDNYESIKKITGESIIIENLFYLKIISNFYKINIPKLILSNNLKLPFTIFNNLKNDQVGLESFLNAERILLIIDNNRNFGSELKGDNLKLFLENYKQDIKKISKENKVDVNIFSPSYFSYHFQLNYDLIYYSIPNWYDNITILIIEKLKNEERKKIEFDTKGFKKYLDKNMFSRRGRTFIYPFEPYASKISVKNVNASGFEDFPSFTSCSLLTPFKDVEEYNILFKDYIDSNKTYTRENAKMFIKAKYINNLIPDKMIDWIILNSAVKEIINKDIILDTYCDFIADYIIVQL